MIPIRQEQHFVLLYLMIFFYHSPHVLTKYTHTRKYPPDRDFSMQNSTVFCHFLKNTQDTETLYTSFESSNIQLFGARRTRAWLIRYDSQNPFIETRTFFTNRGVADLFGGPRPLSLGLQRAAY